MGNKSLREAQQFGRNETYGIIILGLIVVLVWFLTYFYYTPRIIIWLLQDVFGMGRTKLVSFVMFYQKYITSFAYAKFLVVVAILFPAVQFVLNYVFLQKMKDKEKTKPKIRKIWKLLAIQAVASTGFIIIKSFEKDNIPTLVVQNAYVFVGGTCTYLLFYYIEWIFEKKLHATKVDNVLTKAKKFSFFEHNLAKSPQKDKYTIQWNVQKGLYLNMINSRRGTLLIGVAGSGKSYSVINPFLTQVVEQEQCLFNYDVKFPELTLHVYNDYMRCKQQNKEDNRSFAVIYPNDIRYTYQSNPFDINITDTQAACKEAVTTILYNINKTWPDNEGEFFQESAISFATASVWFLNVHESKTGIPCCSLPHMIEFITYENNDMVIDIVMEEESCQSIMAGIATGYRKGATDQIAGQVASLQIALSKIVDPNIYYIACKNNINLDVNNPDKPVLLNLGGAIKTQKAYAPVLSLYASTIKTVVNRPNRRNMGFVIDEVPTIYIMNLAELPNTGRSAGISTLLGLQNVPQLTEGYGDKAGEVLKASFGNVFFGQVADPDSAAAISQMMGEYRIENSSKSVDEDGRINISHSQEWRKLFDLDELRNLQPGEIVGAVSDMSPMAAGETKERRSQFAVQIKVTEPPKVVSKLPYMNTEVIEIFKKEIKNDKTGWIKDYKFLVEYFQTEEEIKTLKQNRSQINKLIAREKHFEIIKPQMNKFIKYYQTEGLNRFTEMFAQTYTFKEEFLKHEAIKTQKNKTVKNEAYYKNMETEMTAYIQKHESETQNAWNSIEPTEKGDTIYIPYLFGFIKNAFKEKEEQRIMESILESTTRRIKDETENVILDKYFYAILIKQLRTCLVNEKAYEDLKKDSYEDSPIFNFIKNYAIETNSPETLTKTNKLVERINNAQSLEILIKEIENNAIFLKEITLTDFRIILEATKKEYKKARNADSNFNTEKLNKTIKGVISNTVNIASFLASCEKLSLWLEGMLNQYLQNESTITPNTPEYENVRL